jgi:hypothetical protein
MILFLLEIIYSKKTLLMIPKMREKWVYDIVIKEMRVFNDKFKVGESGRRDYPLSVAHLTL